MGTVDQYIDAVFSLDDFYPEVPPFDVSAVLADTDEVPVDIRFRAFTKDSLTDVAAGVFKDWLTAHFAYDKAPDHVIALRHIDTAVPPAYIVGDDYETTMTLWQALTTPTFTVTDSDSNSTLVTCATMAGVTTFAQVLTILNAGLAALTTPDVVGLDDASFSIDPLGRVVLNMPSGQDDTDPTITITYSATPATVAYRLGLTAAGIGTSRPGYAAETYLESYNAGKILASFFTLCLLDRVTNNAAQIAEAYALATQATIDKHPTVFVDTSDEAIDPTETDDLYSVLEAAGNIAAMVIFGEYSDEYWDAAGVARFLAEEPGVAAFGGRQIYGTVKASGSANSNYDLTATQRVNALSKGVNFVDKVSGVNFVHKGKSAAGKEFRMVAFKYWMEAMVAADGFAFKINQPSVLFDNTTLAFWDKTLRKYLEEGGPKDKNGRGVVEWWEITLPELSDFTAQNKSENHMPLLQAFRAGGTYEGHTFEITGSITNAAQE